jgi:transcriptional regulator
MYNPRPNQVHDERWIRAFVAEVGAGTLVTATGLAGTGRAGAGRIEATFLPLVWEDDTVVAHCARANPQVRALDGVQALWIVQDADAYISPSWYPAKREHGRVVPTWNYSVVHLRGQIRVHDDPSWLRAAVALLTDVNERAALDPWSVDDAPDEYVDQQLRAIVGIEMAVSAVEAKAKWSQNRSEADQTGVLQGLRERGRASAADAMARVLGGPGESAG